jgi:hypothetical protein
VANFRKHHGFVFHENKGVKAAEIHTFAAGSAFCSVKLGNKGSNNGFFCIRRFQKQPAVGFFHIAVDVYGFVSDCGQIHGDKGFARATLAAKYR